MSSRRVFLFHALAWPASAWSAGALGQGKQAPVLIGFLSATARPINPHRLTAFREGMAALGWTEGAQFVIDERYADGKYERLTVLAKELAAKKPAVIVANSSTRLPLRPRPRRRSRSS